MATAFGPYRPDQPATVRGISRNISGAIPTQDAELGISYRPMPNFNVPDGAGALGGAPRGAVSVVKANGDWVAYAATATTVEQLQADYTWNAVDSGLSISADEDRVFATYGVYLLYTDTTEGMRAYNFESGGAAAAVTDAPDAAYVFVCNETVIALNCDGENLRWQNSALGDHTNWTTRESNGDSLEDGAELIAGGDLGNGFAIVVQTEAVRLFTVGRGPSHVGVTKLADGIGSVGERSFRVFNGVAYWLDRRGFYMSNGSAPVPIGSGKINQTFLDGQTPTTLLEVKATVDPDREIIWWLYDGTAWGYHWTTGEWCKVPAAIATLFHMATPGYTLNQAAALGTLNQLSAYPLNSRFWKGKYPSLAGIDSNQKIGFFDGTNMAATLDTGLENSDASNLITSVSPLTDDPNVTVAIGSTDNLDTTPSFGSDVARQPSGRCPVRGRGKNIAFREKHASGASWTYARGIAHPEGNRGGVR